MLNRITNVWVKYIKPCFYKQVATCHLTLGERGEDGFAPLFRDGEVTNVRLYLWGIEDFERLQKIATELQKNK